MYLYSVNIENQFIRKYLLTFPKNLQTQQPQPFHDFPNTRTTIQNHDYTQKPNHSSTAGAVPKYIAQHILNNAQKAYKSKACYKCTNVTIEGEKKKKRKEKERKKI